VRGAIDELELDATMELVKANAFDHCTIWQFEVPDIDVGDLAVFVDHGERRRGRPIADSGKEPSLGPTFTAWLHGHAPACRLRSSPRLEALE